MSDVQPNFVRALLKSNEQGATYQGHIWDRFLTIVTNQGEELDLFDWQNISTDLVEGLAYKFLMSPLTYDIAQLSDLNPERKRWLGTVIEPAWLPTLEDTTLSAPQLFVDFTGDINSWAVVRTEIGDVLLHSIDKVEIGDQLTWNTTRFYLYGVIVPDEGESNT